MTITYLKTPHCPECGAKGQVRRHRRRNWKYQYICDKCGGYFMEDSQKRIWNKPGYQSFFQTYIKKKGGVNISELVAEIRKTSKISRASVYRHIIIADVLIQLKRWALQSGLFQRPEFVNEGIRGMNLIAINQCSIRRLHIDVIPVSAKQNFSCIIRLTSEARFAAQWPTKANVVIPEDKDGRVVEIFICKPFVEEDLLQNLAPIKNLH